jgi:hypothetical protein
MPTEIAVRRQEIENFRLGWFHGLRYFRYEAQRWASSHIALGDLIRLLIFNLYPTIRACDPVPSNAHRSVEPPIDPVFSHFQKLSDPIFLPFSAVLSES